jgi:branched-chain amino acid transport system permease protein
MDQHFWFALIAAPVACAFLGILIERFIIRNTWFRTSQRTSGHLRANMVITEVVSWIYGSNPLPVQAPSQLLGSLNFWSGVQYPLYRLFILVLSGMVLAFMFYILRKTRLGISIRASVQDRDMANALGTNVATVSMVVMGIGAWLAGIAGVIVAPYLSVYSGMYGDMIMDCFAVIAVGGLGSLGGAFIASLLVGQVQSFGVIFIPRVSLILIYLLMVVVFALSRMGFWEEE